MNINIKIIVTTFIILCHTALVLSGANLTRSFMTSICKIEGTTNGNIPFFGTCFFLTKQRTNRIFDIYLITAAHILKQQKSNYIKIYLRKNENGRIVTRQYKPVIKNKKRTYWKECNDIAVMPVNLPDNIFMNILSYKFLANEDKIKRLNITTANEVNILGFPYGIGFEPQQYAILRLGVLANYSISDNRNFLIDFNIHEGYSGAPVIITKNNNLVILGIITKELFIQEIKRKKVISKGLGLGKAAPAGIIRKLIDSF